MINGYQNRLKWVYYIKYITIARKFQLCADTSYEIIFLIKKHKKLHKLTFKGKLATLRAIPIPSLNYIIKLYQVVGSSSVWQNIR